MLSDIAKVGFESAFAVPQRLVQMYSFLSQKRRSGVMLIIPWGLCNPVALRWTIVERTRGQLGENQICWIIASYLTTLSSVRTALKEGSETLR